MDLRLTNNELEIKHATKEDVVDILVALKEVVNFKFPLACVSSTEQPMENLLNEEIVKEPLYNTPKEQLKVEEEEVVQDTLKVLLGHNTLVNVPKKKLVFDKCQSCGDIFGAMIEVNPDIAPTIRCKCGHSQGAYDLTKGSYECECGQKGFFLMTPEAQQIKCKSCDNKFYMVKDDETNEFLGYC